MGFWGWVQAIAVGWFTLSILVAIFWGLAGRKIFRKPPAPPVDRSNVHQIVGPRDWYIGGGW